MRMVRNHGGIAGEGMMTENIYHEIETELLGVLDKNPPDLAGIQDNLLRLEGRFGAEVYSEFLHLLSHLHFEPAEAKKHWLKILTHREALELGKKKPVDFRVAMLDYFISVNHRIRNPKIIEIRIFQKTRDSAIRDELTGLYNYRHFREELKREVERAERRGESVSLGFYDIDNFKAYNDRNGHLAGDRALQAVARCIQGELRRTDFAARYGGEEFAVIFPGAGKAQALKIAERIRKKIAGAEIPFGEYQPGGRFTISGGVATFRADAKDPDSFLDAADRALYVAKGQGRNLIVPAGSECREYPRLEARIPGKLRRMASPPVAIVTDDLSERGFRFQTGPGIKKGDYFGFNLQLPPPGQEVSGIAQALRVHPSGDRHSIAARIVEMPSEELMRLKDFLASPIQEPAGAR